MPKFKWTKDNIRQIINMWPTNTAAQIAAEIGTKVGNVSNMVSLLRKSGVTMVGRGDKGRAKSIINELISEGFK